MKVGNGEESGQPELTMEQLCGTKFGPEAADF